MNHYLVKTTFICFLFLNFTTKAIAEESGRNNNLADTAETLKAMRVNAGGVPPEEARLVVGQGEVLSTSKTESGSSELIVRYDSTLYSCEIIKKHGRCWQVKF